MWETLVELDTEILKTINNSFLSQYPNFWLSVTNIYQWIPLYILFFGLSLKYYGKKNGSILIGAILLNAIATLSLTNLVKNNVERLRPNQELSLNSLINVLQQPENFSFWSGHSAVSMSVSVFVILILNYKKPTLIWFTFLLWPLLFGLSRIVVGVHYPLDVIIGYLVGAIIGFSFYKFICKPLFLQT